MSNLKIKTSSVNVSADGRISQLSGNQFHIAGPATEKARRP